jgi:NADPH-dependent 2,4-dienoyl-CoA reductase/sulfur reductase-like enzyme/nitrite reductase/ring-hydroxylating ferredoxin subunit
MKKEYVVMRSNELRDREMKEVLAGDMPILVIRVEGKYYAFAARCPHRGGPLAEGVLSEDRVVCPWHQGSFRIPSGDLEEPPPLDSLPGFEVRVEDGAVIVVISEGKADRREIAMVRRNDEADNRHFVIIGSGAAGGVSAEALRQVGFEGRITMVTRENDFPYDRTGLSKGYLKGLDPEGKLLPLRADTFYAEHDIDILFNKRVLNVDVSRKIIAVGDGSTLPYDSLLVAAGGVPRHLDVPGSGLRNIFTFRSLQDANGVIATAEKSSSVVVIGASFIGMETAANLRERGLSVTVVAPSVAFKRAFGEKIGRILQQLHGEHGVTFESGRKVARFEGEGKVEAVLLDNGERLECDFVVLGIGVRPATGFLDGISLNPDGSVPVNEYFEVQEGLYAAGDIVSFIDWRTGGRIRIEHWRSAQQQGRIAAHNMVGHKTKFRSIPFFWTAQFGVLLQYVGHATDWDEIVLHGQPSEYNFMAFYIKDDVVLAALGCEHSRDLAAAAELMRLDRMPNPTELRRLSLDLVDYLNGKK